MINFMGNDIRFDLSRFVKRLRLLSLPHFGTKLFDLNLLRRSCVKFGFFMRHISDLFIFHRANLYKFFYNVVKLTRLFSIFSYVVINFVVPRYFCSVCVLYVSNMLGYLWIIPGFVCYRNNGCCKWCYVNTCSSLDTQNTNITSRFLNFYF
jgi:hypothetical protein